ncbi:MAG: hypothetical protein R3F58_01500 [Steroidobacteraceae bacterium]
MAHQTPKCLRHAASIFAVLALFIAPFVLAQFIWLPRPTISPPPPPGIVSPGQNTQEGTTGNRTPLTIEWSRPSIRNLFVPVWVRANYLLICFEVDIGASMLSLSHCGSWRARRAGPWTKMRPRRISSRRSLKPRRVIVDHVAPPMLAPYCQLLDQRLEVSPGCRDLISALLFATLARLTACGHFLLDRTTTEVECWQATFSLLMHCENSVGANYDGEELQRQRNVRFGGETASAAATRASTISSGRVGVSRIIGRGIPT